ncbi:hypothetical protein BOX15_Mlig007593g1 [Macrostomum lignano]|uniref:Uncharacterized protein n=1 Tax=Macrostomum lignano TaxID=282301 RepID=A0A267FVT0_9PLAT|nr:hypothetical protein BOX15_Mlig007593g1 [Macrostomum lignano]
MAGAEQLSLPTVGQEEEFEDCLHFLAKHSVKSKNPAEIQALMSHIVKQHNISSIKELLVQEKQVLTDAGEKVIQFPRNSLILLLKVAFVYDALQQRCASPALIEVAVKQVVLLFRNSTELPAADLLMKIDQIVLEARRQKIDIGNYDCKEVTLRSANAACRPAADSGLESMLHHSVLSNSEFAQPGSSGSGQVSQVLLGNDIQDPNQAAPSAQPPPTPQIPSSRRNSTGGSSGGGGGNGSRGGAGGGGGGGGDRGGAESATGGRRVSLDVSFRIKVSIKEEAEADGSADWTHL